MVVDTLTKQQTLGAVLAGGGSRRFGEDKAMMLLGGCTLLERSTSRLAPQVGRVLLSGPAREGCTATSLPDEFASEGPLTGILTTLGWAKRHGFAAVLSIPCDVPFVPSDLALRLARAMRPEMACTIAASRSRQHPAIALWRVAAMERIEREYAKGARSLKRVQPCIGYTAIPFDDCSGPQNDPFFNINTAADLTVAQAWLEGTVKS